MNKYGILTLAVLLGWSNAVGAQEPMAEMAAETAVGAEKAQEVLTYKEKERLRKQEALTLEREQATGRFKQKAIERAQEREKKQLELQKERAENASRFQKAAMEADARKVAEEKGLIAEEENSKSRFTRKAEARAEERAKKDQERKKRKAR